MSPTAVARFPLCRASIVDESTLIIVPAELVNSAADSGQLATLFAAVKMDVGRDANQVLADAGYCSKVVFEQLCDHPSELIVALGCAGKEEMTVDPTKRPFCAAMAEKFKLAAMQATYRKRKWLSESLDA